MCPANLRAMKERIALVDLVEGNFHDIVMEYVEEGGAASIQVSLFSGKSPCLHPCILSNY